MLELRPIIVDENNIIVGGNQRYRALLDLNYKEIEDAWVKRKLLILMLRAKRVLD